STRTIPADESSEARRICHRPPASAPVPQHGLAVDDLNAFTPVDRLRRLGELVRLLGVLRPELCHLGLESRHDPPSLAISSRQPESERTECDAHGERHGEYAAAQASAK